MLFGLISPCTTLPCLFQKRPSSFLHFGQLVNIHGHLFEKKTSWFVLAPYAHRQSRKDDEHFANHPQIYVSKTFTKTKISVLCAEYPVSSKFYLSKWKTYFSQFIDKFLKIEEVEYLIHYVKFKMWPALLILCKFPTFWMLVLACSLFSPIYREIENWDFKCCSRLV